LADAVEALGARLIAAEQPEYGHLLRAGFREVEGTYTLTLDADLSHSPDFVPAMWEARHAGEVVVASRYAPHGEAHMPRLRRALSRALNLFFGRGLSLAVDDLSSGFRLYRTAILHPMLLRSGDFDVLEEILIRSHAAGWRIVEVPFTYRADPDDRSRARPVRLSWAFLRTFYRMWKLRNSIDSADYDYRAFDSPVPLQRYWQRRRHRIVMGFARGAGRTLDVGCGSSHILLDLPDAVGLDIRLNKLRFMRRRGADGVGGSAFSLPFADESFDCVISSELIEHLPADPRLFAEMRRVLRPEGRLIVGTPDYGGWVWPTLEFLYARLAPGGYADEHITHYTQRSLRRVLATYGFQHQETRWVGGGEMIMQCVKQT
jgi:SAM-dependent methyltransferase